MAQMVVEVVVPPSVRRDPALHQLLHDILLRLGSTELSVQSCPFFFFLGVVCCGGETQRLVTLPFYHTTTSQIVDAPDFEGGGKRRGGGGEEKKANQESLQGREREVRKEDGVALPLEKEM